MQESRHDPHRNVPQVQRRTARAGTRPFPGGQGPGYFRPRLRKAWADWQKHQTLLINEKRLNMMNAEDRKYLQGEMDKYFSGEEYAKAEGYVPPAE